ncbi:Cacna2d3 [Symbiodinium sp. CCMP2592]|nr:Cacna2d3 [Symbiodinium sp. CCMP2592]
MVSKLLRLRERATEASTWELLREMQRGPSGVTWAGRWSSAVRLLGPSRDKVDFEWLIKQLARAFGNEFFDKKFDRSVAEMTKESVETTCKALLATRRLMARLVKECSAPGQSRKWLDSLAGMLSPERIHVSTATDVSDDFLATAMLGATDSEAGVLTLLNDLANLKYLKAIGAVAAYVNTSSSQWSDHRIQSIVSETVQAYGKEHLRPIVPPAVTEPPPAPAEEPETAAWNDADVAAAGPGSSTSAPATAVLRDQRLREAATHEMQRYSKMLVVSDLVDANGVQSVLSPSPGCLVKNLERQLNLRPKDVEDAAAPHGQRAGAPGLGVRQCHVDGDGYCMEQNP